MYKYNFSKTINKNKLLEEIAASNISARVNNINVLTDGTSFDVWFKDELIGNDLTTLYALVAAHDASGIQEVNIVSGFLKDDITGKLKIKDEPFNGPLYVPFCRFKTGLNDATFKAPESNNFWSIDVSLPGITKVSFTPTYNYQIDGVGFRSLGTISGDVIMKKVVLAPDLSPYIFMENKIVLSNDKDQRFTSPKYIKYYGPGPYLLANRIQFVFEHSESENAHIELFVSIYPQ